VHETERPVAVVRVAALLGGLQSVGLSPLVLAFMLALALAPLFIRDNYIIYIMTICLMFGSQAMAFDFTSGFINIVNFGFAAYVGLGGYTSALLAIKLGVNPWIGMLCGLLAAALLGFLVGILTLRLRGIYATLMSWFVGLALMAATAAWDNFTRGNFGLCVPPLLNTPSARSYYYILLPFAVLMYVVLQAVARSRIGLAFRAIGQNLAAAEASGIQASKYKVLNFTLSCACAGWLGGFMAHFIGILTPAIMDTGHTTEVLTLAYIGGRGSIWGGLVAAFIVIPVFEYIRGLLEFRLIIYGLLLILIMIFSPSGIAGLGKELGKLFRRMWINRRQEE